jgi:hypothetical protein
MTKVIAAQSAHETTIVLRDAAKPNAANATARRLAAAAAVADIAKRVAAGEAGLSADAALDELAAAERAERFHRDVLASAEARCDAAFKAILAAQVASWERPFNSGVEARADAMKRGDDARAALARAERDFVAATALVNEARSHGWRRHIPDTTLPRFSEGAAAEAKFWSSVQ